MEIRRAVLLQAYATGGMTWSTLQARGVESYGDVLAGLSELGLSYPIAPMDGPNAQLRSRGRAILRDTLRAVK